MLPDVALVDQWRSLERELPPDWALARLSLALTDPARAQRAAGLLGSLAPVERGTRLRFSIARGGAGPSTQALRRALERLDDEEIRGGLELLSSERAEPATPRPGRPALAAAWDEALAVLPEDWTDALCELELDSSDYLDRGALLLAPLNPSRRPDALALGFRCARRFGYGAAAQMARRCLARLDAEGITGEVRVLRLLSDTRPIGSQGPVWRVGGRSV